MPDMVPVSIGGPDLSVRPEAFIFLNSTQCRCTGFVAVCCVFGFIRHYMRATMTTERQKRQHFTHLTGVDEAAAENDCYDDRELYPHPVVVRAAPVLPCVARFAVLRENMSLRYYGLITAKALADLSLSTSFTSDVSHTNNERYLGPLIPEREWRAEPPQRRSNSFRQMYYVTPRTLLAESMAGINTTATSPPDVCLLTFVRHSNSHLLPRPLDACLGLEGGRRREHRLERQRFRARSWHHEALELERVQQKAHQLSHEGKIELKKTRGTQNGEVQLLQAPKKYLLSL